MRGLKISFLRLICLALVLILTQNQNPIQAAAVSCDHTIGPEVSSADGTGDYSAVQPGDTVCITAGTRNDLKLQNFTGTKEKPIIFINYGGKVSIDAAQNWVGLQFINSEHIRLTGTGDPGIKYGFEIFGATNTGIHARLMTRHFEFDHLEIHHSNVGIRTNTKTTEAPAGWIHYNIIIHDCYIHDQTSEAMYIGKKRRDDGTDLHGVKIYNNHLERIDWDGIQVRNGRNDVAVFNNYMHSIGGDPFEAPGDIQAGAGLNIQGGTVGQWYNNLIVKARNGVQIQASDNVHLFNNTIVNSEKKGVLVVAGTESPNSQIYNNIIALSGEEHLKTRDAQIFNNLTFDTVALAKFVDPTADDYRLLADSPAVDAGIAANFAALVDFDDIPRPQGELPDLGAFEYLGEIPPPDPSPTPTLQPTDKPIPEPTDKPAPTFTPTTVPTPKPTLQLPTPPADSKFSGPIKINFQPASAPVPAGYEVDDGSIYDGIRGYGWNRDHTDVVRDRNINSDQRLDTLILVHENSHWEVDVPDGTYSVEYGVGDPGLRSKYFLEIEDMVIVDDVKLDRDKFIQDTKIVAVSDGKLTVGGGAVEKNTRINYLVIDKLDSPSSEPTATSASTAGLAALTFDGPSVVEAGETFEVRVQAKGIDAPGIYGAQFRLNYDPDIISVGDLAINPDLSFVLQGILDNQTGTITLAASRKGQVAGLTGNVTLLTFEATAKRSSGPATFTFADEKISDPQAQSLDVTSQSYTVSIGDSTADEPTPEPTSSPTTAPAGDPTLEPTDSPIPTPTSQPAPQPTGFPPAAYAVYGQVSLAGRAANNLANTTITVAGSDLSITTDAAGRFSLTNTSLSFPTDITADAPSYLPAACTITALAASETTLTTPTLLSGDLNDDLTVDIIDATAVGASFGKIGSDLMADINLDGVVDIYDVVLVTMNFGQNGPQLWACQ